MNDICPIISVTMPAYNAAQYIREAIDSILGQTYSNFELIIINDGSTDTTEHIIKTYNDTRIVYIANAENKGYIYSLNLGMKMARGKYIARMDADDVTPSHRLEKQFAFMEGNPDITIVGGAHRILGTEEEIHFPKYDEEIKLQLFTHTPFSHPTVMMRLDVLKANDLYYEEAYKTAEDYRFWTRTALLGLKLANFEDVLLDWRRHNAQTSTAKVEEQMNVAQRIANEYFKAMYKLCLTDDELTIYWNFSCAETVSFEDNISILSKIYAENKKTHCFNNQRFSKFLRALIYKNIQTKGGANKSNALYALTHRMPISFRKTILALALKPNRTIG